MGIMDLLNFVKSNVNGVFYPLSFPASSPDDCITMSFVGGTSDRNTVQIKTIQFIVRNSHPSDVEVKVNELIAFLNGLTDQDVEGHRLILSQANQHHGLYLGTDSNGRHLMSVNFKMLID